MEWSGRRVLVSGGVGFLGSNLCRALAARGAAVTALDNFAEGGGANLANLDNAPVSIVRADMRDVDLRPLCAGADVIFNLAALTSHMGGQQDPLTDLQINAMAQLRLIEAARRAAPDAVVVHASSRQIYGRPHRMPVDESHPVAPPDFNAVSKLAGEQYWMLENRIHGRPVVSLRLTNCYGPGLRVKDAQQNFLGIWIRRVLEGQPFEVWGGEQVRDLCYVDDATQAFLLAAKTPACSGRIFNVGGSVATTLKDIADALVGITGGGASYSVRQFPADRAAIDIGSYRADDAAFRESTGWNARTPLAVGLRHCLDWYRQRLAAYV